MFKMKASLSARDALSFGSCSNADFFKGPLSTHSNMIQYLMASEPIGSHVEYWGDFKVRIY